MPTAALRGTQTTAAATATGSGRHRTQRRRTYVSSTKKMYILVRNILMCKTPQNVV